MTQTPARQTAVVIPSLKPDEKLCPYLTALSEAGFRPIVLVDDGSGADSAATFAEAAQIEGVTLLRHEVNRGKGAALRTAFAWLRDNDARAEYIVTADADGQHTVTDILRMTDALAADGRGLLLGTRDFSLPIVPFKSRAGNRITSTVFRAIYGAWVPDTQTGLRGARREHLQRLIDTEGDRYEYEMNMLISFAGARLPITQLPIETVYENDNAGSHFRAFRDSARIYRVIFRGMFKFLSSSFLSTGVDILCYFALIDLLRRSDLTEVWRIGLATWIARVISAGLNFAVNKKFVFRFRAGSRKALPRYLCVCVAIACLSWLATTALHTGLGMSEKIAKVICDCALFFLSFQLQRNWVFRAESQENAAPDRSITKE